jgi:predicted dienelactone hydrolase
MTAQEVADLRDMAHNSETGAEGVCDFVRLLIHRERNRRKGLAKPLPSDWQGVYRVGGRKKTGGAK